MVEPQWGSHFNRANQKPNRVTLLVSLCLQFLFQERLLRVVKGLAFEPAFPLGWVLLE